MCGRLAPASRPSLISANTLPGSSLARRCQASATRWVSSRLSSARERTCRRLCTTTSCRSSAGYRFGTTRTFQSPSSGSTSVCGGVMSSCPAQNGHDASSSGLGGSSSGRAAPGRLALPGAITATRPEAGSRRSSPLRSARRPSFRGKAGSGRPGTRSSSTGKRRARAVSAGSAAAVRQAARRSPRRRPSAVRPPGTHLRR